MSQVPDGPQLVFKPSWWEVELKNGELIEVRADGVSDRNGVHSFVVLVVGSPNYEYEICRIPKESVKSLEGGWDEPRLHGEG
jgi:hypothetical protein